MEVTICTLVPTNLQFVLSLTFQFKRKLELLIATLVQYIVLDSTVSDSTADIWLVISNLEEVVQNSNYENVDSLIILRE